MNFEGEKFENDFEKSWLYPREIYNLPINLVSKHNANDCVLGFECTIDSTMN